MGDDIHRKVDVADLTHKAESDKGEDRDALHKTLDALSPKDVREAMKAMVDQNSLDRHNTDGTVKSGVPELKIKFEDDNPNKKVEALNKSTERSWMDPRKLFGDKMSTSEEYRPPDETWQGKFRDAISSAVLKLSGMDKVVNALDQGAQH